MGLNRLLRRLTVVHRPIEKSSPLAGDFSLEGSDAPDPLISTSSPDILLDSSAADIKKNFSNKKHSVLSVAIGYPSCPALATDSSHSGGIAGCCAAPSSASLATSRDAKTPALPQQQQQTERQHYQQWLSRRKSLSLFAKARRPINNQPNSQVQQIAQPAAKKHSWLSASPPFLRTSAALTSSSSRKASATVAPSASRTTPPLPESILCRCLDAIDDPFQLYRLRALSRAARDYVGTRLARIVEMDVRKVKFDTLQQITATATSNAPKFIYGNDIFYAHPAGLRVLMRFVGSRVEVLVEDCWTSHEVALLCQILAIFRHTLRHIAVDAPIFELLVASLSKIDLDRWYAFHCYMKAINDFRIRLIVPPRTPIASTTETAYWPLAESIIIRSTEHESAHLSRILDYGVRSQTVMNRRQLNELKIVLTDVGDSMSRELIRNLYHFRCWAGSAGFDDRFTQQRCAKSRAESQENHNTATGAITTVTDAVGSIPVQPHSHHQQRAVIC